MARNSHGSFDSSSTRDDGVRGGGADKMSKLKANLFNFMKNI